MHMQRMRWRDLTPAQKWRITIQGILRLVLLGATLYDLRCRPAEQIRGSKKLWTALAFVQPMGPIAYFIFGRIRQPAAPSPVALVDNP